MRRQWILGLLIAAACSTLLLVVVRCSRAAEGNSLVVESATPQQADQVLIESQVPMAKPEIFDTLERPPVVFDHQKHTEALKEEGCKSCHPSAEKTEESAKTSYEYVAWRDMPNRQALMDAYHGKCMKCHFEGETESGKKVRALSCGECHTGEAKGQVEWYQPVFDHFPHLDAMEKGCDTCHHEFDEQQKKLVYVKGHEQACGKCHKDQPEENRDSLRNVGHASCIGCHEKEYKAGTIKMDPYTCRGCHRPEAKKSETAPVEIVARTYQAQPGQLLISYQGSILPPVPFDHQKHDPKKDCTKCCHNFHVRTLVSTDMGFKETASSCENCHKQADVSIRPGCLQADMIYHDKESPNSCIGCHIQKNKEEPQKEQRPVTCKGCHKGEVAASERPDYQEPVDTEKGPETSIIARISNKYLPVKFPHLQHTKMITNCDSCHHHGPQNQRPACYTCHGEPMDFMKLTKPRLISAYHRMCMGCHQDMGTGPVACTKCHEEKETIYPSGGYLQTAEMLDRQVSRSKN